MTLNDTLTKTQEKVSSAVEQGQSRIKDAVDNIFGENPAELTKIQQKVVNGVRKGTERLPVAGVPSKLSDRMTSSKLLTPSEVAERSFEFAGKVIENQRAFVSALIDAGTKPEATEEVVVNEKPAKKASKKTEA